MKRILPLTAACVLACNEPEQAEDCYAPNPDPGAMLGSVDLVCGQPFGYRPQTPEGLGLEDKGGPYHVALCEPAESSTECAMCPTADVNDRITEHIVEVMREGNDPECASAQVDHIIAECVTTPEQGSSTGCCFNAWYWGSCNIKG